MASVSARRVGGLTSQLRFVVVSSIGLVGFVILWSVSSAWLSSPFMPGIPAILSAFADNWLFDRMASDVLPSLARLAVGYFSGILAGFAVGAALGSWRTVRYLFEGLIEFLRAIPKVAILPIFFIFVGIGDASKILVIATAAAVPILLNTMDGFRSIDGTLLDTCKSYGLSRLRGDFLVRLRWATPHMFAGARVALAIAFIMMIVSEMYGASNGIGYYVLIAQQTYAIAGMWSGILLLGLLGGLFSLLFSILERFALAWYRGLKSMERA